MIWESVYPDRDAIPSAGVLNSVYGNLSLLLSPVARGLVSRKSHPANTVYA